MSGRPTPWLPAAEPGALERDLARLAAGWSDDWLQAPPPITVAAGSPVPDPAQAWHGCAGAGLGTPAAAAIALGHAALGHRGDLANARDRQVVEAVGRRAAADLAERLCRIAAPAEAPGELAGPPDEATVLCLQGGEWSLAAALGSAAAVRLRRRFAGRREPPPLARLGDALAGEAVTLGCHLGRAELSAGEVATLGAGDLVVLDRRVDDPLPLTVHGTVAARGRAAIEARADTHAIRITETLDLSAESA
jgi:flagellar motor switch/type III secretory pathway protein FliN